VSAFDIHRCNNKNKERFMKTKELLLILTCISFLSSCIADPVEKDWRFEQTTGGILLREYIGDQTEVTIPETINGKRVVVIEGIIKNNTDDECTLFPVFPKSVSKVHISSNLSTIGSASFAWCDNIESIEIPENVVKVGDFAFYGCKKLTKVLIDSNTDVGYKVFANCPGIDAMDAFVFGGIPWRSNHAKVHQIMISKGYTVSSLYSGVADLAGDSQKNWWYDGTMFGMPCSIATHFEGGSLSVVDIHFSDYSARDKLNKFLVEKYGGDRIAEKQGMRIDIRKLDFDTAIALSPDQMFGGWVLSYFHKSQLEAEKSNNGESDL